MVAYLKYLKSIMVEFMNKMFKVDADSYGTSKNNFVNSAYHCKELDALTGKRINFVT